MAFNFYLYIFFNVIFIRLYGLILVLMFVNVTVFMVYFIYKYKPTVV